MQVIIGPVLGLIDIILGLYVWVLFLSIIMSWLIMFNVVNTTNRFVYVAGDFLYKVTEPALRPIRRFIPNIGGMDISPIVLLLAIWFVRDVIRRLAFQLGV
ncbi:MAG: YggT family protein [Rhodospirillales bacterium]|nr:YggT family protein [Rhodospirillales bacterium]